MDEKTILELEAGLHEHWREVERLSETYDVEETERVAAESDADFIVDLDRTNNTRTDEKTRRSVE